MKRDVYFHDYRTRSSQKAWPARARAGFSGGAATVLPTAGALTFAEGRSGRFPQTLIGR